MASGNGERKPITTVRHVAIGIKDPVELLKADAVIWFDGSTFYIKEAGDEALKYIENVSSTETEVEAMMYSGNSFISNTLSEIYTRPGSHMTALVLHGYGAVDRYLDKIKEAALEMGFVCFDYTDFSTKGSYPLDIPTVENGKVKKRLNEMQETLDIIQKTDNDHKVLVIGTELIGMRGPVNPTWPRCVPVKSDTILSLSMNPEFIFLRGSPRL